MDIKGWVAQTEALETAARALVAGDMTACLDAEVIEALHRIERVTNMVSGAVAHKLVHELGVRSIAGEAGLHNTANI